MTDREQLRERLAEAAYSSRWVGDWSDVGCIEREFELQVIDAILAEIEHAGYVVMERGRAERLRACAGVGDRYLSPGFRLQPGDLDPLEGGE